MNEKLTSDAMRHGSLLMVLSFLLTGLVAEGASYQKTNRTVVFSIPKKTWALSTHTLPTTLRSPSVLDRYHLQPQAPFFLYDGQTLLQHGFHTAGLQTCLGELHG